MSGDELSLFDVADPPPGEDPVGDCWWEALLGGKRPVLVDLGARPESVGVSRGEVEDDRPARRPTRRKR